MLYLRTRVKMSDEEESKKVAVPCLLISWSVSMFAQDN
jgi:hypothetical protein